MHELALCPFHIKLMYSANCFHKVSDKSLDCVEAVHCKQALWLAIFEIVAQCNVTCPPKQSTKAPEKC